MKAVILAAGYATRLYPLTKDAPKPLLPIKGRPMIDYIIDEINTIGAVSEIFVVSNHRFANSFERWAKTAPSNIPLVIIDDGTETEQTRLGAIGDINFTLEAAGIDDELLIIAGDSFFTFRLSEYYAFFRQKQADCVAAKEFNDRERLKQFAVALTDGGGRIISLIEKPEEPPSNLAVYAAYFYTRETAGLFKNYLAEGNKPDAPGYFVQWLYRRKPVYAYIMNGDLFDIGTPEAYREINER
jgi:glucose-1-phosphate thymidylyltransferase